MKKPSRPLKRGDLIKLYHFTGARRKRYYMYKLIVESESGLQAVDVVDIAVRGLGAFSTTARLLIGKDYEIIAEEYEDEKTK